MAALGGTNEDVIKSWADTIASAVVERIRVLAELGPKAASMTPEQLVKCGACDPVRLFVKQEPHSQDKILAGRFRLICSVSLIDQVVERVLFGPQNRIEIASWTSCPSKPGMGLDDIGIEKITREVRRQLGADIAQTDISGWDWSVQSWEQDAEAEMRIRLSNLDPKSLYASAIRARMIVSGLSVFVLSSGKLFSQLRRGVMKSGQYITSSSNSRIRILASKIVRSLWAIAMGDDCLEKITVHPNIAKQRYADIGHTVKEFKTFDGETFAFCSTLFRNGKGEPQNWHRSLYRLLSHSPITKEFEMQFCYEMRHSPHLLLCRQLLDRLRRKGGNYIEGDGSSHISGSGNAASVENGQGGVAETRYPPRLKEAES